MADKSVTGCCHFCGQTKIISLSEEEWLNLFQETDKMAEEIADELAAEECDCRQGEDWRTGKIILERCQESIEEMFREHHPEIADLLQAAKEYIWSKRIKRISISTFEDGTASMYRSGGNIEIRFVKKNETKLTVGE